jgi:HTH-type transcriptional regulator/antitoxin HigA
MNITPIRSEEDYQGAMQRLSALIPKKDQRSVDEMDVLHAVIEKWEREQYEIASPTPVEAIRFRMEQGGLKPRDLEPMIGPRSRVSEVLSGRRSLTIDMIRALHAHLGIPLASLVGEAGNEMQQQPRLSKTALDRLTTLGVMKAKESYAAFRARAFAGNPAPVFLRKSRTARTNAKTDTAALEAWCAAVFVKSANPKLPKKRQAPHKEFGRTLAKLSASSTGPLEVKAALAGVGVIFLTLKHLPGTFLDGAVMCRGDGTPIIALTLRHDRVDNFWFTLLHEYAHVCCHLGEGTQVILDDLEVQSSDGIEKEADMLAQEALIPPNLAKRVKSPDLTPEEVVEVASEAEVHPAVVAGRWQREHGDYRRFSKMLGRGEISAHFSADED